MKRCRSILIATIFPILAQAQDEMVIPHVVQRGETINILANRFRTSVETLKILNYDFEEFYTGMSINLPRPNELRNISDNLSATEYDALLKKVEEYWNECNTADRLFSKSKFKAAHKYYSDIVEKYSSSLNCDGARYGMAVCSYHAENWNDAVKEFNLVIKSEGCSDNVREVSESYKEEALAQIEQRKARRNRFWENLGNAFAQAGQMALQMYADANSQEYNSYPNINTPNNGGSALNTNLPEVFNPYRAAQMSRPAYSFDSNGNIMISFPGAAQNEAEMNAYNQQFIANVSAKLNATGDSYHMAKAQSLQVMAHTNNWTSALSQQFWNTPMYPTIWTENTQTTSTTINTISEPTQKTPTKTDNINTGSTRKECTTCNGTGRMPLDTNPPQFGYDNSYKVKCNECGQAFPKSWGHTHVTCTSCHGK